MNLEPVNDGMEIVGDDLPSRPAWAQAPIPRSDKQDSDQLLGLVQRQDQI
jgi:hypothetical protein